MADLLRTRISAPRRLRELLAQPAPVVAPGAYDALSARLVEAAGFDAVYMTGFGTAASLLGRPDVGLVGLAEMVDNARRMVAAVDIPVIADADTGYGNAVNVIRTVQEYERAGVAALHLEDQVSPKRCGHVSGKAVVPVAEMVGKVAAAVSARSDTDLVIIARSDARAVEGIDATVARARAYRDAGADMIFIDALESVSDVERIAADVEGVPLLFPWVEGGKTPPVTMEQLAALGYSLVIRPITTLLAAAAGMRAALAGAPTGMEFGEFVDLIGLAEIDTLGARFAGS